MIRVNDRKLSELEFENTFYKIYDYILHKVTRLPERHGRFIGIMINRSLNDVYQSVYKLSSAYITRTRTKKERAELSYAAINDLEDIIRMFYLMQVLSLTHQNEIKHITDKQIMYISGLINEELKLLNGVFSKYNEDEDMVTDMCTMVAMTKKMYKEVLFLQKLKELCIIAYSVSLRLPKRILDARAELLVELSSKALYFAISGNSIIVGNNEKRLRRRKKYFEEAVSCIYQMNMPVRSLAVIGLAQENDLKEICTLMYDTSNIINAIIKSDKRFFDESITK